MAINFTINELKKHLGPGLGLRKNKYLIEVPVPGVEGSTINVLCRSAGLPERTIRTTPLWYRGRQYNVRGETDYGGAYEFSLVDDSNMQLRSMFDAWLEKVDQSKPKNDGILGGSFEKGIGAALDLINSGVGAINSAQNALANPEDAIGGFILGLIDKGNAATATSYQTDVNIWQLNAAGEKVYGYKLQNAFPSAIGVVTLDDGDENTLSEFSVTLTFSEFMPLENKSFLDKLGGALLGDDASETLSGVESLFD
jgi:hypothetical protein